MRGSYCLVLEVLRDLEVEVGSLGKLPFEKGYYVYIGSAMNNLEKRVERHLRKDKRLHWHIDYLTTLDFVKARRIYIKESSKTEECGVAKEVSKHGLPIKAFGCSDCKCVSHLYKVEAFEFLEGVMKHLRIDYLNK